MFQFQTRHYLHIAQVQLTHTLYKLPIDKVDLLRSEDRAFVALIMVHLKPFNIGLAGEVICEQSDIAEEVLFVQVCV